MVIVFVVLGAAVVFAIAAVFVGSSAFRLGHEPTTAVLDLDEAVVETVERLPDYATARLSYDEVRTLVVFEVEHLGEKGLSAMPGEELDFADRPPEVLADDDAVAYVLGRATEEGLDVADEDVFEVIKALLAHLVDIGAIGRAVPPLDPPEK
ncbi:MAG TPA: hypothetical protein VMW08_12975 [Acidimicrobiales bacterium]|nr:hypothetical protein [Acidimicrobiales bacterium]